MKKKLMCLLIALSMLIALAGCAQEEGANDGGTDADKVYRFAIVFNGPVNDGGWNYNAWQGLVQIQEEYGEDRVDITYAEKVNQADYEDTFYGYASEGYDMIFANGFEFSDAALRVAEEFPDVKFGIINGLEYRENVCGLEFDNVELGFIAGVAAGMEAAERGGKVGFLGAEEIPSYRNFFLGLEDALTYVDGDVSAEAFYTGSWDDISMATELTKAVMSNGYDVLVPWVGAVNNAMYTAAEEEGARFVQTSNEMEPDMFRDHIIININQSNQALIRAGAESCIEGTFPANGRILGDLSNGINIIGSWGLETDQDIIDACEAIYDQLRNGEIELPEKVS